MPEYSLFEKIIIWAIPILFAITVHEVAHGWVADKLGDQTAKIMGRITLNPIKHIDPIGTVALPLILLFIGSFIFGWAKPVPVTWKNLRKPRRDMALVALAGPAANLIMMIIWSILAKLVILTSAATSSSQFLLSMCGAGILINIVLMVLNLFMLFPAFFKVVSSKATHTGPSGQRCRHWWKTGSKRRSGSQGLREKMR